MRKINMFVVKVLVLLLGKPLLLTTLGLIYYPFYLINKFFEYVTYLIDCCEDNGSYERQLIDAQIHDYCNFFGIDDATD